MLLARFKKSPFRKQKRAIRSIKPSLLLIISTFTKRYSVYLNKSLST